MTLRTDPYALDRGSVEHLKRELRRLDARVRDLQAQLGGMRAPPAGSHYLARPTAEIPAFDPASDTPGRGPAEIYSLGAVGTADPQLVRTGHLELIENLLPRPLPGQELVLVHREALSGALVAEQAAAGLRLVRFQLLGQLLTGGYAPAKLVGYDAQTKTYSLDLGDCLVGDWSGRTWHGGWGDQGWAVRLDDTPPDLTAILGAAAAKAQAALLKAQALPVATPALVQARAQLVAKLGSLPAYEIINLFPAPILAKNVTGEADTQAAESAPPYAVLQLDTDPFEIDAAGRLVFRFVQPQLVAGAYVGGGAGSINDYFDLRSPDREVYFFNGDRAIASGAHGPATMQLPTGVLIEASALLWNEEIGPTPGSWRLGTGGVGFTFCGYLPGYSNEVAWVRERRFEHELATYVCVVGELIQSLASGGYVTFVDQPIAGSWLADGAALPAALQIYDAEQASPAIENATGYQVDSLVGGASGTTEITITRAGLYQIGWQTTFAGDEQTPRGSTLSLTLYVQDSQGLRTTQYAVFRTHDIEENQYGDEVLTTDENLAATGFLWLEAGAILKWRNTSAYALDITTFTAWVRREPFSTWPKPPLRGLPR